MGLGSVGLFAAPADAGPVFALRELILNAAWQEDGEAERNYSLITWENIGWLSVTTKAKLYDEDQPNKYYIVQNGITFPGNALTRNLDLDWRIEEAQKYRLEEIGAEYQAAILPNWMMALSSGIKTRTPKIGLSYYRQDFQELNTRFHLKSLRYYLSLTYTDKADEESEYTHQTNRLYQSLNWEVNPACDLGLFYRESAGEYPDAAGKNATSNQWGFKGTHDLGAFRLFWRYATTEALHGYSIPGRDQEYRLGGDYQLTSDSRCALTFEAKNHESFQVDPELLEPDEIITDTAKSYRDLKLRMEYQLRTRHIAGNVGYWIERKEFYQVSDSGGTDQGLFGSFSLKWQYASLTARLSKSGTFGKKQMKYQLCLDFKL